MITKAFAPYVQARKESAQRASRSHSRAVNSIGGFSSSRFCEGVELTVSSESNRVIKRFMIQGGDCKQPSNRVHGRKGRSH